MNFETLRSKRFVRGLIDIKSNYHIIPVRGGRLLVAIDYYFMHLTRGINIYEYFIAYKFYQKNSRCRKTYYSNVEAHNCESKANGGTILEFKDKASFNEIFAPFITRGWISLENVTEREFLQFIDKYESCIYKPIDSSMGRGVFKLSRQEALQKSHELYNDLHGKKYLCEECVVATHEICDFNPESLNTVRVVTVNKNGEIGILWSFLRMGRKGNVVDNGHSGGILGMISPEDGLIYTPAYSTAGECYYYHPDSKKQIIGAKIPYWEDIVRFSHSLAEHYPKAVIVGWDIAVLPDGHLELIEGNSKPDFDLVQHAEGKGMKQLFEIIENKHK